MKKPKWAPPVKVFNLVWPVLYLVIAITFGTVFFQVIMGQLPLGIILPFILNLIFNLLFTPIQFGLKNTLLALVDILLVLVTLVWLMVAIYPYFPLIAFANIPYLVWVCFALTLQTAIFSINGRKSALYNSSASKAYKG